jgi:acid stress-induced BolA-like protein IbaG/YrbA
MALQQALEDAIHAVAPQAQIHLQLVNGHITGQVVAPEFEPLTHLERQQQVWDRIRQELGATSQQVGILLLYTPEEAEAVEDEAS